ATLSTIRSRHGFSLERHPWGPSDFLRADALCVAARRIAALAPGAAVLDGGARPSPALDPGSGADLFGSARQRAAGARRRSRMGSRFAARTAARQLARGDRVRSFRAPPHRHLSVVAGLRRDELLGGV